MDFEPTNIYNVEIRQDLVDTKPTYTILSKKEFLNLDSQSETKTHLCIIGVLLYLITVLMFFGLQQTLRLIRYMNPSAYDMVKLIFYIVPAIFLFLGLAIHLGRSFIASILLSLLTLFLVYQYCIEDKNYTNWVMWLLIILSVRSCQLTYTFKNSYKRHVETNGEYGR